MAVIQTVNDQLNLIATPGSDRSILVLDYDAWLDTNIRQALYSRLMNSGLNADCQCSPFETIGAYLKSSTPDIAGRIQVIDLDGARGHAVSIEFTRGRYRMLTDTLRTNIPLDPLIQQHLHRDHRQLIEFEKFLEEANRQGQPYSQLVAEALQMQEKGDKRYDALLAVLDDPDWADIRLEQLLSLKRDIFDACSMQPGQPYCFTGWLSTILSNNGQAVNKDHRIEGAAYLLTHSDTFYPPARSTISLQVYTHPQSKQVVLYTAGDSFERYSTPRGIDLCNNGSIHIYEDDRKRTIDTGSTQDNDSQVKIQLDGNQHIWVSIGQQLFLLS